MFSEHTICIECIYFLCFIIYTCIMDYIYAAHLYVEHAYIWTEKPQKQLDEKCVNAGETSPKVINQIVRRSFKNRLQ